METLNDDVGIIKQDHLGRVLATKDQREAMMVEFERSGMSGAAFARLVGVKYSTFAHWVKQWRERKQSDSGGVAPVRWLEAETETGPDAYFRLVSTCSTSVFQCPFFGGQATPKVSVAG